MVKFVERKKITRSIQAIDSKLKSTTGKSLNVTMIIVLSFYHSISKEWTLIIKQEKGTAHRGSDLYHVLSEKVLLLWSSSWT